MRGHAVAGEYTAETTQQEALIAKDPTNLDALYQLGNYLAWDGRYEEALQVYERLLAKEPKYLEAEVGIARVYAWKGEQDKAIQRYQRILETNPHNYEAYQGLGSLALWVNNFEKAIEYFKRALAINPKDIVSWKGMGRAYLGRGDRRRAEEAFTHAQILELRRTPFPLIVGVAAGVLVVGLSTWGWIGKQHRKRKRALLKSELRLLRLALGLYQQATGRLPLTLETLTTERWRRPGNEQDSPYVEGVHRGDRGFLMDPFGNRYWYNPETGRLASTTKGCELW